MKKLLAVALLDGRRLGFGLASAALVGGLLPSLANGLGAPVPAATILLATFALVGASCGGYFGNDFAEGRSSFFFARPLPTWALIGGRILAVLTLTGGAFVAFMASNWLSTTEQGEWKFWILDHRHPRILLLAWVVSLFVSLGIAARARDTRSPRGWRELVVIPLRLSAMLGAFLLMFGLFADLILRAYFDSFRPIEIFLWSWLIAALVASVMAIAAGRTERLRIARFQNLVMVSHFVLVSIVVAAAWSYVLHPEADAIEGVDSILDAGDGNTAYVATFVNRGNPKRFNPVFAVDIASGRAERLNADSYTGPWTSADGSSLVWSEATPFFFRPIRRFLGGETTFRVRNRSGETALPMPRKAPDYRSARDLSRFGGIISWVLPAPDGDVFAILWDRHLTFTSRTRGQLSDIDFGGARPTIFRKGLFLPSGQLRTAIVRGGVNGASTLAFVDIDPTSGAQKEVLAVIGKRIAWIQFDTTGARALVTTVTEPERGGGVFLAHLDGRTGSATKPLVEGRLFPSATFMSDGRIVASSRAVMDDWKGGALVVFSPEGETVREIPFLEGLFPQPRAEMFPGILAVSGGEARGTSLIDVTTGKVVREIPGMHAGFFQAAPPASALKRLLVSRDRKLYELASVDAQPRLLLPLGRN